MHGNGFLNERKFSIKISLANIHKHVISKYTRHGALPFLHCANLNGSCMLGGLPWTVKRTYGSKINPYGRVSAQCNPS